MNTDVGGDLTQSRTSATSLSNLRDLGGWPAGARRVSKGVVFRSNSLGALTADDRRRLELLKLKDVVDFRSAAERDAQPDAELPGSELVCLDVLADAPRAIPANLLSLLTDPALAAETTKRLAGPDVLAAIADTYRGLVRLPSAQAGYGEFFSLLARGDGPVLFHCTAGKDRTGWAAAALLSVLGVAREDVYREYLLTNDMFLPSFDALFADFAAAGGDPAVLRPVIGVDAVYLDAAFEAVERDHGSVAGYFADGLGIDAQMQEQLRTRYLSDSAD